MDRWIELLLGDGTILRGPGAYVLPDGSVIEIDWAVDGSYPAVVIDGVDVPLVARGAHES